MISRVSLAFLFALGVALPISTVSAQNPYSPASPPNTSSPFAGVALPRPTSSGRQMQMQPGMPLTGLSVAPGGYVASTQVLTSEPIDPNHKLGRGDRLSYRVYEDREPDKIVPLWVTDSGEVNLPLGGLVQAAGKTTDQLRGAIKTQLEKEYYYHATVILGLDSVAQRANRGRVFVTGAVRSVGSVELPVDAPMTASQAIYQMGGPVDFSVLKRTRVMRPGGPKGGIPVNVNAVEKGEFEKDVVLQAGDQVIVPQASWGWKF